MIHETIEIKDSYFNLSSELIEKLEEESLLNKEKLVIGICGESGSGKSVTAICLQKELEKLKISSIILHQDSYFKLPPKDNHEKRKTDLNWVGPNEVQMDLLQSHIEEFKAHKEELSVPIVDYEKNIFLHEERNIKDYSVLIIEGVYAFFLDQLDYKIFMERTYKDTLENRKKRTREVYDPFVETVLDIEHSLVLPLRELADATITKKYSLSAKDS